MKKKEIPKIILETLIFLILGIFLVCSLNYGLGLYESNKLEKVNTEQSNRENKQKEENSNGKVDNNKSNNTNVVLTMDDKISNNTIWCGSFQLIWNDLKNDFAKQDIIFEPQLDVVNNLNKEKFNTSKISENSYYKAQGIPTQELKNKIEKEIKEKFDETSDIVNQFTFDGNPNKYFLYAMLKKEFKFSKEFEQLENGRFGNYENVKYFGTTKNGSEAVRGQVRVLYYNSKEDFAIKLMTVQGDEVIISKGIDKDTFSNIYEEIENRQDKYKGDSELLETDTLSIPNLNLNVEKEFNELENKPFKISNEDSYVIDKAIQTIQFELDKTGGKVKSEAGMAISKASLSREEPREFSVDNTFTIFLKENDKDTPYFAAKIADITQFQK